MVRRSSLALAFTALFVFFVMTFTLFSAKPTMSASIRESIGEASAQTGSRLSSWMTAGDADDTTTLLTHQLNFTKVATVIETRDSPMLIPILQSWLANVPLDWTFVVWTGVENHDILTKAAVFRDEIASGRLNFTRIDFDGSPYRPDPKRTSTLSDLLGNTNWFWTQFHPSAEWMIFFQVDSVLCSKSRETVDDWLGYDFIGGPAMWSHGPGMDRRGGNGGLSMRRISSLRRAIDDKPRTPDDLPEDVWFTRRLLEYNSTRWPEEEGRRLASFSLSQGWIEDLSRDADWKPLGMHYGSGHFGEIFRTGPNGILTNQLQRIIQHCPEFLYLRYGVDEFKDVDMSEFRPGATPKLSTIDMAKETEQDDHISELADEIEKLRERVKVLELKPAVILPQEEVSAVHAPTSSVD